MNWNWYLDGWVMVVGAVAASAAALLGNFLVLRRNSLLTDAISHAVLPGIAVAYFWQESRTGWPMFVGAVGTGILTAWLSAWIRRYGRVDEGAAMGVVFTGLFALGLVLIVQVADRVDLDPKCVLYGAIELTPLDTVAWGTCHVPRVILPLLAVLVINAAFVVCCYRELQISSFNEELAQLVGIRPAWVHYSLMTLVAITSVACFESVGNILVVAMFIVPPATALQLTDRLPRVIGISVVVAVLSAVLGHVSAIAVPAAFGLGSTTTAGSMACVSGVLFTIAVLFAPSRGAVIRWQRRRQLLRQELVEDVLAVLFRQSERQTPPLNTAELADLLMVPAMTVQRAVRQLVRSNDVDPREQRWQLTASGKTRATTIVRTHRLWEQYLAEHAGQGLSELHHQAGQLEHVTDQRMRSRLSAEASAAQDPHGSEIPAEPDAELPAGGQER